MNTVLPSTFSQNYIKLIDEIDRLKNINSGSIDKIASLKQELVKLTNQYKNLKSVYKKLQIENNKLCNENSSLNRKNRKLLQNSENGTKKTKKEKAIKENIVLKKRKIALNKIISQKNTIINEQKDEIKRLKNQVLNLEAGNFNKSDFCENTTCENFSLCNCKVLIVGGIEKMKANYREIVEEFHGSFRYHGGHPKGCCNKLDKLINWADYVICPIDINSHYACLQVKNICKKLSKDYFMLRSSGISTIYKQVKDIARKVS